MLGVSSFAADGLKPDLQRRRHRRCLIHTGLINELARGYVARQGRNGGRDGVAVKVEGD